MDAKQLNKVAQKTIEWAEKTAVSASTAFYGDMMDEAKIDGQFLRYLPDEQKKVVADWVRNYSQLLGIDF